MLHLIALVALSAGQVQASTSATLTIVEGAATIKTGQTAARNARGRDRVRLNDIVSVAPRSQVLLSLTTSRQVYRLASPSSIALRVSGPVRIAGSAPKLLDRLPSPQKSRPYALGVVLRGPEIKGRGIAPVGALRKGPIFVSWLAPSWATEGTLVISSDEGKELLKREIKAQDFSAVELPAAHTKSGDWLHAQLLWRDGRNDDPAGASLCQTSFRVLRPKEVVSLEEGEKFLRATVGKNPKVLADMLGEVYASFLLVDEFDEVIEMRFGAEKESGEAYHRLGELYEAAWLSTEANQAFAKAESLGYRESTGSGIRP